MDTKQLRALIAIDEHHSFSAAARALHTVQSNISTHIARLERELDMVLVDRSTNELTDEGQLVASRARRIEAEFAALHSDVTSFHDEVSGTVRIGVIGTTARWLVPRLLDHLDTEHPKVRLLILDATTTSLVPQLTSGHIDLAVVNSPVDDPAVTIDELFEEERILVAPQSHDLAVSTDLSFAEAARTELLLPAPGTQFRVELDDAATMAGVTLRPQAEIDGMRLLATLAFSGFGAAILPASAAPSTLAGEWERVPLSGLARRSVGLARRRRFLASAADRAVGDAIVAIVRDRDSLQEGIHLIR